uniref:ubiquitinyl hydrolase 1 n=1 Tax=Macrostomum lignano TaxID=282301 RepID=A0A1I8F4H5_9PLAT
VLPTLTADRLDNCFGLPVVFSAPHEGLTYERLVEMVTKKASKIVEHSEMNAQRIASASNANRRTLSDCLKLFTAEEQLGKKDAWHCPKCKKFQCATKKFDIWALPKVLVVHLKRFQFDRICRNKIDNVIEFPLTGLDMGAWAINPQAPATYSLVSVANHFGGLGGGHYTAYGLKLSRSTLILGVSLAEPPAYLLVYVRSDLVHRSGESVELDRLTLAPADPDDHADNNGETELG